MASTMDKIKAKVENVIHPHGHAGNTTSTTGATTGTTHHTDHHAHGAGVTGTGVTGASTTDAYGTTGSTTTPHSSNLANKMDPRVDSTTANTYGGAHAGNTHSGLTGTTGGVGHNNGVGHNTTGSTTTPHSSNLANKMDPRVDSTTANAYGGTHAGNTNSGFTGTTGGLSNSTNAGPHDSNLMNKMDPTVDSDLDGRGNRHGASTGVGAGLMGASGSHATPGSGTAQNTAGPHNSDLANKLDPRVDADMDGSKTIGGNRTHT